MATLGHIWQGKRGPRQAPGDLRRRARASQVVEAAIVMPLLVVCLLATVGGAQMFRSAMTVNAAAAEGARYAAAHPEATDDEIAQWTQGSVGAGDSVEVTVEGKALPEQDYTMRLTDRDGNQRRAEAKTTRRAVNVRAQQKIHVLGLSDMTIGAVHSGIQSTEGVAR